MVTALMGAKDSVPYNAFSELCSLNLNTNIVTVAVLKITFISSSILV